MREQPGQWHGEGTGSRRRGRRSGVEGRGIGDPPPPPEDRLGKPAAHSMADGHTDKWGKARRRPRGAAK